MVSANSDTMTCMDTNALTPLRASIVGLRVLFAAAAASCALVDESGEALRFEVADGAGADRIIGVRLPISRGIAGWVVVAEQAIAVRDVGADPRFDRDVAASTEYVPTSILAAPVMASDGEVLGVLEVLDPGIDIAGAWPLSVLATAAEQVGILLSAVPGAGQTSPDDRLATRVRELAARGPAGTKLVEDVLTAVTDYLDGGGR